MKFEPSLPPACMYPRLAYFDISVLTQLVMATAARPITRLSSNANIVSARETIVI